MSAAPRPRRSPVPATLDHLLAHAGRSLARAHLTYGHGTVNAREEAACLVLHALKIPPASVTAATLCKHVSNADRVLALNLVRTRIERRVPAAYLTREAWLQNLRFYVDERVIVPRSFIAELLSEHLDPWISNPVDVRSALDLCTGSGCLAVMLAKNFLRSKIDAVDLSLPALEVARRNVTRYRLGRRINLIHSDLFAQLGGKRYDLIISNPPYVRAAVMRRLPPEYRREPALALAGGDDGFALVDVILNEAARHLSPRGMLVVEIGHRRRQLETAYPGLPFTWPDTSGGDDCVFMLSRDDLVVPGALRRRPVRRRAI